MINGLANRELFAIMRRSVNTGTYLVGVNLMYSISRHLLRLTFVYLYTRTASNIEALYCVTIQCLNCIVSQYSASVVHYISVY